MRIWLKSITSMLGLEDTQDRTVRQILDAAVARTAVVGLGTDEFDACPDPECCLLDSLDGDTMILVPAGAESMRGIAVGARYFVAVASSRGFHRGETTILSRWIEHGEDGAKRFGFRASIPSVLVHLQRRDTHRVPVAFDLAPTATLMRPTEGSDDAADPCVGSILDLSETGLRLRVPEESKFELGQILAIEAQFPSAIPSFKTTVEVVRIGRSKVPKSVALGLRFPEPLTTLGPAIRALDLRRGGRPAA